jgi:hypothetical protein
MGAPSDHFHGLSVIVTVLSPLEKPTLEYRLSAGLIFD